MPTGEFNRSLPRRTMAGPRVSRVIERPKTPSQAVQCRDRAAWNIQGAGVEGPDLRAQMFGTLRVAVEVFGRCRQSWLCGVTKFLGISTGPSRNFAPIPRAPRLLTGRSGPFWEVAVILLFP